MKSLHGIFPSTDICKPIAMHSPGFDAGPHSGWHYTEPAV
jgi:glyoxylase I family protein